MAKRKTAAPPIPKPKQPVHDTIPGLMTVVDHRRTRKRLLIHELQATITIVAVSIDIYYRIEFFQLHTPLGAAMKWMFEQ